MSSVLVDDGEDELEMNAEEMEKLLRSDAALIPTIKKEWGEWQRSVLNVSWGLS